MKQSELIVQLEEKITALTVRLDDVEKKVTSLFVTPGPEKNFAVAAPVENLSEKVIQELGESDPVKADHRTVVNNKLNKSFGIHQKAAEAGFAFTVIVPEKYSRLNPNQKALDVPDFRTRVIPYAEGILGVEEWVDLIYKNFTPDVQAIITNDRLSYEQS